MVNHYEIEAAVENGILNATLKILAACAAFRLIERFSAIGQNFVFAHGALIIGAVIAVGVVAAASERVLEFFEPRFPSMGIHELRRAVLWTGTLFGVVCTAGALFDHSNMSIEFAVNVAIASLVGAFVGGTVQLWRRKAVKRLNRRN